MPIEGPCDLPFFSMFTYMKTADNASHACVYSPWLTYNKCTRYHVTCTCLQSMPICGKHNIRCACLQSILQKPLAELLTDPALVIHLDRLHVATLVTSRCPRAYPFLILTDPNHLHNTSPHHKDMSYFHAAERYILEPHTSPA